MKVLTGEIFGYDRHVQERPRMVMAFVLTTVDLFVNTNIGKNCKSLYFFSKSVLFSYVTPCAIHLCHILDNSLYSFHFKSRVYFIGCSLSETALVFFYMYTICMMELGAK